MSLLLDALKKAADDKQKASQGSSAAKAIADTSKDIKNQDALTLESDERDIPQLKEGLLTLAEVEQVSPESGGKKDTEENELAATRAEERRHAEKARFTITDDALSLLIHKTNRNVKYGRRILIISVVLASLAIVIAGGVYYYNDTQIEIAMMERKHQLEMRAMQSKTNREQLPEQILRDPAKEVDPGNRVQAVAKQATNRPATQQTQRVVNRGAKQYDNAASGFSIQKTKKTDPVGERLDDAWLAYEAGQYDEAKNGYNGVLLIEADNRDALLGLGAIAIIEKDHATARNAYLTLLRQDPRDPIASAALSSLQGDETTLASDEAHLLAMLKKAPHAPQLKFALGNNYAQQNKWKLAQQAYFSAWQADDENADYIYNLAVSLDQLNKHQQAVSFYKECLLKSIDKKVSFSRETVQKRIVRLSGL